MVNKTLVILYVADQQRSRDFYAALLQQAPILDVPGMTEFELSDGCLLGLMPEAGIQRLLGDAMPALEPGHGVPRCEVYLCVDDAKVWFERAVTLGAQVLSPVTARDWGDEVGYVLDPDAHVVAVGTAIE